MAKKAIKYNFGICTNKDKDGSGTPCPKCATKERIQVLVGHEFVCPECGEPLHKVAAPKTFMEQYGTMVAIICAVLVIGGVVCAYNLNSTEDTSAREITVPEKEINPEPEQETPVMAADDDKTPTVETEADNTNDGDVTVTTTTVTTTRTITAKDSNANIYGNYVGEMENGMAHGMGTMTYVKRHLIDERDPDNRIAEVGDYVTGEFYMDKLVQGRWYDKDNNLKGSIIIGRQ